MTAKVFVRYCQWCGRSFNHWRSHWNHEKKCGDSAPRGPAPAPEQIAAASDPFKGFREGE